MLRRLAFSLFVMCTAVVAGTFAQQSVTASGQFSTFRLSTDTASAPNGSAVVHFSYGIVSVAEDPGGLFNAGKGDCVGTSVVSEDGTAISSAGWCFMTDMDGDGWWQWWKTEEIGTPDCPIMCGTWGSYNGVGKFESVSITGTFESLTTFADGSGSGAMEGTYERR